MASTSALAFTASPETRVRTLESRRWASCKGPHVSSIQLRHSSGNIAAACSLRRFYLPSRLRNCALSSSDSSALNFRTAAGSEEHQSELQSLMRISYDVFCLQNKK